MSDTYTNLTHKCHQSKPFICQVSPMGYLSTLIWQGLMGRWGRGDKGGNFMLGSLTSHKKTNTINSKDVKNREDTLSPWKHVQAFNWLNVGERLVCSRCTFILTWSIGDLWLAWGGSLGRIRWCTFAGCKCWGWWGWCWGLMWSSS